MAMKMKNADRTLQAWIDARTRYHLTHAQIQMARELGMNPAKLGKLDNHHQESGKLPLPQYIEDLYRKRFGKPFLTSLSPSKSDFDAIARRSRHDAPRGSSGSRR